MSARVHGLCFESLLRSARDEKRIGKVVMVQSKSQEVGQRDLFENIR